MVELKNNNDKDTLENQAQMPLVHAMNKTVPGYISWCTPSIPDDIAQIRGVYKDDISVSFHALGSFLGNTGIFDNAHKLAADAHDADMTLFSVNGTTGSNFIVLYTLASSVEGNAKLLTTRNIHKSVLHACELFHIDIDYLPTNYDNHWHMYLPPSIEQVKDALAKAPEKYNAVLLTNPTYGGLTCKLKEIVEIIHDYDPKTWAFVDEAWGSHLHFTEKLPYSAMEAAADITVQSTHKQGGALQQSGMIHVKGERVDTAVLKRCHQHLTTTSPSYHLLASLDAARWYLEHKGKERLNAMIELANDFRNRINDIPGLSTFGREFCDNLDCALDMDLTKIQVRTVESGFAGFDIDKYLEGEMHIITEKSDAYTIMFLTTLEIKKKDMLATSSALTEIITSGKYETSLSSEIIDTETIPFPVHVEKVMTFPDALNAIRAKKTKVVEFDKLEGQISAENITLYPPGIPIIVVGERFSKEVLDYLENSKRGLTEIIANDPKLKTVEIIDL